VDTIRFNASSSLNFNRWDINFISYTYQKLLCQKLGVFESMLSLPQPGQTRLDSRNFRDFKENALKLDLDGSCDKKALVLPHSAEEFDHLLSFIHPK
jgi:hypothetical protein